MGADLDLRKVRYFAAVAAHLHFGRAADELNITQPALSRQIQALERELGCALLQRTSRSVVLTTAGEQLHQDAQALLGSAAATLARIEDAARGSHRLVLGHAPGMQVSQVVRAFAQQRPDVTVELLRQEWWEKEAPLHDGRVDISVLRTPFDHAGLHVVSLSAEPRVLCLPSGHPLASREALTMDDLRGQPMLDAPARTSSVDGKLELIAAGQIIALVPLSIVLAHPRPDVVHRRVRGVADVNLCLAVVQGRGDLDLRQLFAVARRILSTSESDEPPAHVPAPRAAP